MALILGTLDARLTALHDLDVDWLPFILDAAALFVAFVVVVIVLYLTVTLIIFILKLNTPTTADQDMELPAGDLKNQMEALAAELQCPPGKVPKLLQGRMFRLKCRSHLAPLLRASTIERTLEVYSVPEILALFGHEVGHWKRNDYFKNLAVKLVSLFVWAVAANFVLHQKEVYVAFGFDDRQNLPVGILIFTEFFMAPFARVRQNFLSKWDSNPGFSVSPGLINVYMPGWWQRLLIC